MKLGARERLRRTAKRIRRRTTNFIAMVGLAVAVGVLFQVGRMFYADVRLRQELAPLLELPCSEDAQKAGVIEAEAQRLAQEYGLSPQSVTLERVSDCVSMIKVDGQRELDLVIVRLPWHVQFAIASK